MFPACNLGWSPVPSALGNHVSHVVAMSAEKQMFRINAARVVASMQHVKAIVDWAVGQFPRKPMGGHLAIAEAKSAISAPSAGSPIPAIVNGLLVDVTPKALMEWCFRLAVRITALALFPHNSEFYHAPSGSLVLKTQKE